MKRPRDNTFLILLGCLTLITLTIWIGSEVYRGLAKDRISGEVSEELVELNSTLNLSVLQVLSARTPSDVIIPNPNDN